MSTNGLILCNYLSGKRRNQGEVTDSHRTLVSEWFQWEQRHNNNQGVISFTRMTAVRWVALMSVTRGPHGQLQTIWLPKHSHIVNKCNHFKLD